MNSLDANVILHYLLDDIPGQTLRARTVIIDSPCYVTDVVITEVTYVLERVIGLERTDIALLLSKFLGLPTLVYNDYFLNQVIDLYRLRKTLSFVDCYVAVEAKVNGNSLVYFDKELVKHGGKHVTGL